MTEWVNVYPGLSEFRYFYCYWLGVDSVSGSWSPANSNPFIPAGPRRPPSWSISTKPVNNFWTYMGFARNDYRHNRNNRMWAFKATASPLIDVQVQVHRTLWLYWVAYKPRMWSRSRRLGLKTVSRRTNVSVSSRLKKSPAHPCVATNPPPHATPDRKERKFITKSSRYEHRRLHVATLWYVAMQNDVYTRAPEHTCTPVQQVRIYDSAVLACGLLCSAKRWTSLQLFQLTSHTRARSVATFIRYNLCVGWNCLSAGSQLIKRNSFSRYSLHAAGFFLREVF